MIQRIQSIYLLLVAILNGLLFVLPLNEILSNGHFLKITTYGLFEIVENNTILIADLFPILAIISVSIILAIIAIFLYKNRKTQMRIAIYNSILGFAATLLTLFYTYQIASTKETEYMFTVGLLLPIVGSVFSFLAYRAIKKDDNLVKSIDRIR